MGLGGLEDVQVAGWVIATVGVGILGVVLAGYLTRRLPLRRARWAVASLGLLAFVSVLPDCATVLDAGVVVGGECRAVVGTMTFVPASADQTGTIASLAIGAALAVGIAPLIVPLLRARDLRDD